MGLKVTPRPLEKFFKRAGKKSPQRIGKNATDELEAPPNLPPSYLVSASYDGDRKAVVLKLYEPNSSKIYLWYDDSGHQPYCLSDLPPEKLEEDVKLMSHRGFDRLEVVEKRDLLFDKEVKMTKVVAKDPLAIGRSPGCIREILPKAWESEIKYHENYLYDKELMPCMPYKVEDGRLVEVKVPLSDKQLQEAAEIFREEDEEIKEQIFRWLSMLCCPIPNIRRTAVDIEVYSPVVTRLPDPKAAEHPVICVSSVGSDEKRVLVLKRAEIVEGRVKGLEGVKVEYYDEEVDLLREVFRILREYPFVITFNGDEFDLRYLWHRALKLGFRKDQIPITLSKDFAALRRGVHIDLCRFLFNKSIQVYAFGQKYREVSLDDVGRALIGVGKAELEKPISELAYGELIKYCLRDAEITYQLTSFSDDLMMKLIVILSRISALPIDDVTRLGVSNWIRSAMYFEHRRRGALIPNPKDLISLKGVTSTEPIIKGKYKGALVVEPVAGVHFDVQVLDFASLYPSIIKKWNLSYETVLCPHSECRDNLIPGTDHWICKKRRGIASLLIGSLRDLRVKWYKPKSKDERLPESTRKLYGVVQQALKVVVNASYGVFGAEHFSLYCPPVAESTAALGRYAITKTIEKAKSLGIDVIYGDTDSIFLKGPTEEQVNELINWSSESLGLDLEVDKVYRYAVLSTRKKNYMGVYPDGRIDLKGLTGKKRHVPGFLKKAFSEMTQVLSQVRTEEEFPQARERIRQVVRKAYERLKKREYSLDELAIHIMLGKLPEKYKEAIPQHVRVAMLLEKEGVEVKPGDIIAFVKTKGEPGVKPIQLASREDVDVDKYVAHLEATFSQVLDTLDLSFAEIIGFTKLERFL